MTGVSIVRHILGKDKGIQLLLGVTVVMTSQSYNCYACWQDYVSFVMEYTEAEN